MTVNCLCLCSLYDTTQDHFINVTGGCSADWPLRVRLEVGVFVALCQYFNKQAHLWQTDGIVPLAQTTADQAVCSTRHLTSFAASLFVPVNSVSFVIHVSHWVGWVQRRMWGNLGVFLYDLCLCSGGKAGRSPSWECSEGA